MTKMKKLLGALAVGVLLLVTLSLPNLPLPALATALRTLVVTTLTATTATITTLVSTTLTAATIAATGAISTTSGGVKSSSSSAANLPFVLDGQYTTAQVQAKTPSAAGQLIYNATLTEVCVSTGTTIEGYARVKDATTCQ